MSEINGRISTLVRPTRIVVLGLDCWWVDVIGCVRNSGKCGDKLIASKLSCCCCQCLHRGRYLLKNSGPWRKQLGTHMNVIHQSICKGPGLGFRSKNDSYILGGELAYVLTITNLFLCIYDWMVEPVSFESNWSLVTVDSWTVLSLGLAVEESLVTVDSWTVLVFGYGSWRSIWLQRVMWARRWTIWMKRPNARV